MPRLVELARIAGVTPQQVRNYLDQGFLPPAERAPNGYRVFTQAHADALVTTRALAAGHGWGAAREIMNAVHTGQTAVALALVDSGHAELARERAHIAAATAAFAEVAATPTPPTRPDVRIGDLARDIGVKTPVLRQWESRGLLVPSRDRTGYRVYDPAEQRIAHLIAVLRRGDYPFPIIEAVITTLRATGDPTRARTELARRDRDVHHQSLARLRGSAALLSYLDLRR
ncbi:MerR family transcriptional regulator [Actinokineospora fastidiosa]|uniref:MerR family transcriptional regulator n=1 Tax=Actinokineospora fastidiosa TaxID=1816 RepID=A0A918GTQ8_9PSEU|nr:MerR family transcriptional regulator [Actinokineospora fastidiosa]GGS57418.1 MerR family transcriptional regulator [Actinokineospora fastidiosa]